MIRTEREYTESLRRIEETRAVIAAQEESLKTRGLTPDDIELAMDHLCSFRAQMEDEAVNFATAGRIDSEMCR